jgi:hypothetical protein
MDDEIGLCDYCACADLFDTWYQDKTEKADKAVSAAKQSVGRPDLPESGVIG